MNLPTHARKVHSFAKMPNITVPRSSFDRDCRHKTTFDMGYTIPVLVEEVLPGDTFNIRANFSGRLATQYVPIMDNIYLDMHWFFVPNRLVWDNFQKFMGEQENPGDSTDFLVPVAAAPASTGYATSSLQDYLDMPVGIADFEHGNLVPRGINLIWNEWYRDQNLQDSITVDKDDGPDDPADYDIANLRRGKRADYFTSCLPFAQKGDAVTIPLGDTAEVTFDTNFPIIGVSDPTFDVASESRKLVKTSGGTNTTWQGGTTGTDVAGWDDPGLEVDVSAILGEADMSTVTAVTVNALRQASALQRLYETDARYGTRYVQVLKGHWGVDSPDQRLQRPEYLGGGTTMLDGHVVPQTSQSDTTPQGTLAAFSTVQGSGMGFVKSFVEHGYVIGMLSARADLNYQQGLPRMYSRSTKWDFAWPEFAHLGEQEVLSKEIYLDGTSGDDDVFGYQERYAEYRSNKNKVTGQMRSQFAQSLDIWHLAQEFGSRPVLNDEFIIEDPPIERALALADYPHFVMDCFFNVTTARALPVRSIPGHGARF